MWYCYEVAFTENRKECRNNVYRRSRGTPVFTLVCTIEVLKGILHFQICCLKIKLFRFIYFYQSYFILKLFRFEITVFILHKSSNPKRKINANVTVVQIVFTFVSTTEERFIIISFVVGRREKASDDEQLIEALI